MAAVLAVAASGCGRTSESKFLVGFSQCNLGEPWRVAMNAEVAARAKDFPQMEIVFADAQQDNAKQVADVENFLRQGINLLMISPNEAKPLTAIVRKAYERGIPVIVIDRAIEGDSYTVFIGADNRLIGDVVRIRARVRVVDDRTAIRRHRHVLDHELSRRQQQWIATSRRDGIEMRPAVQIRQEDETIVRAPFEIGLSRRLWKRSSQRLGTLPDCTSLQVFNVADPDGPRRRPLHER